MPKDNEAFEDSTIEIAENIAAALAKKMQSLLVKMLSLRNNIIRYTSSFNKACSSCSWLL